MTDAPGALSPLDEDGINAAVEEALAAFAAAGTLAELRRPAWPTPATPRH